MPPNPRKDCPQLGGQTGQQLGLSCVHQAPALSHTVSELPEPGQKEPGSLHTTCGAPTLRAAWWPTHLGAGEGLLKEGRQPGEEDEEGAGRRELGDDGCPAGRAPGSESTPGAPPHTRAAGAESREPSGAASAPAAPLWRWTQAPNPIPTTARSPDRRLSEELSPGHLGVSGHGQTLRQDAQGQDEI